MHFNIHHTTRYAYSQPVFLEPHFIRLRPRSDANQFLAAYRLEVTPRPAGRSEGLDAENNTFTLLWFDGLHDHLEIAVTAEADTLSSNPYHGLLLENADRLPFSTLHGPAAALQSCLELPVKRNAPEPDLVDTLVQELLGTAQGRTLDFLGQLNTRLHQTTEKINRLEPGIQIPSETLQSKKGACRDLAVLFMTACRQVGIPARFVSGYQQGNPDEPEWDLHAWAEVFLPGFGWKGYDPTHGLVVADRHIVVAAAALPHDAAPITGHFRGTGAAATITHRITIHIP